MATSFAGLFYLSLWLSGKLHIMDNRGEAWKTIIVMAPILAATLIAVSRIMDARHHPFDVITGSLLGIACGWVSYRQYFPSLSEPWKKGRAHPIRTWGSESVAPAEAVHMVPQNDSMAPLRNHEEEQMAASDLAEPSGILRNRSSRSAYVGGNPYVSNPFSRPEDDNWSSSSEDVANGYEMHGYSQTQNPALSGGQLPRYESDTSYPSRTHQTLPGVTALNTPPEAVTPHPARGRTLTDTPIHE
ncbi:phosphatidic acid phosphatase type [Aspergillus wentii]|nr:phosphatidic acid phosphatase type [Aspergillus wentii]